MRGSQPGEEQREQHSRQREQHVGWLGGGSHVVLSSVAPQLTVGDDTSVFPAFLMGAHLSQSPKALPAPQLARVKVKAAVFILVAA